MKSFVNPPFEEALDHGAITCGFAHNQVIELADKVLDAGQCNDSYSLVVIALKLKEAFVLDDINQLPIGYNIACFFIPRRSKSNYR